jgi:signal transduction histidine kinase
VIDRLGTGLEQFVTVGMDARTHAEIGTLPTGRGILGVVIRERRPLRLRRLGDDPRSIGFPAAHPPMGSFLGVPILIRGTAFGNLYLTEKARDEEFSDQDEEVVRLLAAQAAVAIENARLYESVRRWSVQLESLNEISEALSSEIELDKVLALATGRVRELLDARGVMVGVPSADGLDMVVEAVAGEDTERLLGMRIPRADSKMGQVLAHRRSERIDSIIEDPVVDQTASRLVGSTTTLVVPLVVGNTALGVIAAWDKQGSDLRFTDADVRLAEAFANRAALALELAERVSRHSVETLVEGQERERRRLARELHDETLQGLAVLRIALSGANRDGGLEAHREATMFALDQIDAAVANLRAIVADLRPPGLDELGTEAGLQALVERSSRIGLDVRLEVELAYESGRAPTRHVPELEAAIFRIVQEALHNAAKHSCAGTAVATVRETGSEVDVLVHDDGRGFDPNDTPAGYGLIGIRERVQLLGGSVEITSAPGSGTSVHARIPVRRREP